MTVGAFVRLEQAPQNEMREQRAAHAFATLLPLLLPEAEQGNL